MERVERSRLNPALYNPRTIDRHSKKRLRESVRGDGLVETLTWNRRTGNLVSGHQRLAILDEEAEGKPYSLDVAVIDVDEATERQLNVRLNNVGLMGEYDFDALLKIVQDEAVPIDMTRLGFDPLDLEVMFPEQAAARLFSRAGDAAQGSIDVLKQTAPDRPGGANAEAIQKMKDAKNRAKREARASDSAEYWVAFVGADRVAFVGADRVAVERFLVLAGLDPAERFHSLEKLATLMGLDLESEPSETG